MEPTSVKLPELPLPPPLGLHLDPKGLALNVKAYFTPERREAKWKEIKMGSYESPASALWFQLLEDFCKLPETKSQQLIPSLIALFDAERRISQLEHYCIGWYLSADPDRIETAPEVHKKAVGLLDTAIGGLSTWKDDTGLKGTLPTLIDHVRLLRDGVALQPGWALLPRGQKLSFSEGCASVVQRIQRVEAGERRLALWAGTIASKELSQDLKQFTGEAIGLYKRWSDPKNSPTIEEVTLLAQRWDAFNDPFFEKVGKHFDQINLEWYEKGEHQRERIFFLDGFLTAPIGYLNTSTRLSLNANTLRNTTAARFVEVWKEMLLLKLPVERVNEGWNELLPIAEWEKRWPEGGNAYREVIESHRFHFAKIVQTLSRIEGRLKVIEGAQKVTTEQLAQEHLALIQLLGRCQLVLEGLHEPLFDFQGLLSRREDKPLEFWEDCQLAVEGYVVLKGLLTAILRTARRITLTGFTPAKKQKRRTAPWQPWGVSATVQPPKIEAGLKVEHKLGEEVSPFEARAYLRDLIHLAGEGAIDLYSALYPVTPEEHLSTLYDLALLDEMIRFPGLEHPQKAKRAGELWETFNTPSPQVLEEMKERTLALIGALDKEAKNPPLPEKPLLKVVPIKLGEVDSLGAVPLVRPTPIDSKPRALSRIVSCVNMIICWKASPCFGERGMKERRADRNRILSEVERLLPMLGEAIVQDASSPRAVRGRFELALDIFRFGHIAALAHLDLYPNGRYLLDEPATPHTTWRYSEDLLKLNELLVACHQKSGFPDLTTQPWIKELSLQLRAEGPKAELEIEYLYSLIDLIYQTILSGFPQPTL
ncbi:MAG: hypothetical protein AB7F31_01230 [Parachlamydiales bacterium]